MCAAQILERKVATYVSSLTKLRDDTTEPSLQLVKWFRRCSSHFYCMPAPRSVPLELLVKLHMQFKMRGRERLSVQRECACPGLECTWSVHQGRGDACRNPHSPSCTSPLEWQVFRLGWVAASVGAVLKYDGSISGKSGSFHTLTASHFKLHLQLHKRPQGNAARCWHAVKMRRTATKPFYQL